jgi:hypothetical protein
MKNPLPGQAPSEPILSSERQSRVVERCLCCALHAMLHRQPADAAIDRLGNVACDLFA